MGVTPSKYSICYRFSKKESNHHAYSADPPTTTSIRARRALPPRATSPPAMRLVLGTGKSRTAHAPYYRRQSDYLPRSRRMAYRVIHPPGRCQTSPTALKAEIKRPQGSDIPPGAFYHFIPESEFPLIRCAPVAA